MTAFRVFDGHLDLAHNALWLERELTDPIDAVRGRETACDDGRGTCGVTLEAMRAGGVAVCLSTIVARAKPWVDLARRPGRASGDWPSQAAAHAVGQGQLAWYHLMHERGVIRLITTAGELDDHLDGWDDASPVGVILTIEGADPVAEPEHLERWHAQGVRTLMLAHFGKSHYAHGTPAPPRDGKPGNEHDVPGPLTDRGLALLSEMDRLAMPLDLSHLSDPSFEQALDVFGGRVYSSHTACRAVCDIPRNHPDDHLRAIFARDGVVGVPLYTPFLVPAAGYGAKPGRHATLDDLAAHLDHLCQLAGDADHAAIGSDLDGGFGTEDAVREIGDISRIARIGEALAARGYDAAAVAAVLGGNWRRFHRQTLPAG